jgi:hypothetical protein
VKTEIVAATQEHVRALYGKLRQSDVEEIKASCLFSPNFALRLSYETSELCWTGVRGGVPLAMCGFGGPPTDAFAMMIAGLCVCQFRHTSWGQVMLFTNTYNNSMERTADCGSLEIQRRGSAVSHLSRLAVTLCISCILRQHGPSALESCPLQTVSRVLAVRPAMYPGLASGRCGHCDPHPDTHPHR